MHTRRHIPPKITTVSKLRNTELEGSLLSLYPPFSLEFKGTHEFGGVAMILRPYEPSTKMIEEI